MKNMKRLTALFLSLLMVAVMLPAIDLTSAAAASTPDDRIFDSSYIYFDLYYGDVTITDKNYTGYVYTGSGQPALKTGSHSAGNKYYIFQSNGETLTGIPEYTRVMNGEWGKYITNNTDVLGVIEKWDEEADKVGRKATPSTLKKNVNVSVVNGVKTPDEMVQQHYRIIIEPAAAVTTNFNVTIDNVWSGFQNDDCRDANGVYYQGSYIKDGPHYRTSGGLTFRPGNKTTTATITMLGDNRFGNVHYEVGGGVGGTTTSDVIDDRIEQLVFKNGDSSANPATLTVANLRGDTGDNHFCAVIGGANNPNYVPGLVFEGGTIYAGGTELDNCTAIGGGGCGFGGVTIKGGTITAVAATNGTAIGGGIGDGSNGGAGNVLISGGTVYAYNLGLAIEGTRESKPNPESATYRVEDEDVIPVVMPAVAIGSGSSRRSFTVPAVVTITGGTVYAESTGGTVIGGGSSNNYDAANAIVNIGDPEDSKKEIRVTAKSVAGQVRLIHEYDQGEHPEYIDKDGNKTNRGNAKLELVSASTSIGGGTAGVPFRYGKEDVDGEAIPGKNQVPMNQGNGGDAILNISGENTKVYAGSIGGGGTSKLPALNETEYPDFFKHVSAGKIGSAQVEISGGVTQGQVIMAKGAEMNCSFLMSGGTIDNSTKDDTFVFLKENGGAVYVENGDATMTGGTIKNCDDAKLGGVFYVVGGNVDIEHGIIENNKAVNGGVAYVDNGSFKMESGTLKDNEATYSSNSAAEAGTEGYGGAVYAKGGDITIGVLNCTQETPCADHAAGKPTYHPVITNNKAAFGGAFAVYGGTISFYCCDMTGNTSMGKGTGMNVFMSGETGVINHHYDGANIGSDEDHGMVSIGGTLNVIQGTSVLPIKIKYHSNHNNSWENYITVIWNGEAPDGYYLNLPYCPTEWEKAPDVAGYTFAGWTEKPTSLSDADAIRSKDHYHDIGKPYKIEDAVAGDPKEMDFYAVWAPLSNGISYAYSIDDTVLTDSTMFNGYPTEYEFGLGVVDTTQSNASVYIPNAVKPGYTFIEWKMYADKTKISNWDADASSYPVTLVSYLKDPNPWNGKIEQNFGDITLVAIFEPAYTDLKIEKSVTATNGSDANQSFVFRITGKPDNKALANIDMKVTINYTQGANSEPIEKLIEQLPVGTYKVVELTDWSWRYTPGQPGQEEISNILLNDPEKTGENAVKASFSNSRKKDKWLSGDCIAKNLWNKDAN